MFIKNYEILNYLIKKYYLKNAQHKTASSHWREYNKHSIENSNDVFHKYNSIKLCNFIINNYRKYILSLTKNIYSSYLYNQYQIRKKNKQAKFVV